MGTGGIRIGIDPGILGALAFLDDNLKCLAVFDMPIMTKTLKRQQVNGAELAKIIERHRSIERVACLEQVSAWPGQGVSSVFSFGCSYGIVLGVLAAFQIPVVLITPASWKKRAGLVGKDKDMARTLAQQLYPAVELGRKRDIGRADALLIARFGLG